LRAAIVSELGSPPQPGDWPEPEPGPGEALIDVAAAAINPVDLSIASGRFFAGNPQTPYVAGGEGVGTVVSAPELAPGTRVRFEGRGAIAERIAVPEDALIELPAGVDDAVAAGLGVAGIAAWLALEHRARLQPGETVLVLGASGAVGQVAVQAARALGAGRIVAAARSADGLQKALALGADATVTLRDDLDTTALATEMRDAAQDPIDVVIDPLWGAPATAAAEAAGPHARLVNLGQSAGAQATLTSGTVRGKMLSILGHFNFLVAADVRRQAYRALVDLAAAGRMRLDCERVPLEDVAAAWERQAASPQVKLIIDPRG
jgi:NADPH:quinone reductase-like Zn-dependent oxidoreductase